MVFKLQEYSHTFYNVTPHMLIICKMMNNCLCWLFLFGVDIIRDYLQQVIELPFCAAIKLGRHIVYSTIWKKNHLESFSLFPALTPIQNESDAWKHWKHVTCTYFDMAGYDVINYVTGIAKWHHWTFFLKFASCTIIRYQNVQLQTSMGNYGGDPILRKFALYFN